jgi:hypothetical protein
MGVAFLHKHTEPCTMRAGMGPDMAEVPRAVKLQWCYGFCSFPCFIHKG